MSEPDVLDEIRHYRENLAKKFENDIRAIVDSLKEREKKSGQTVSYPKRKKAV